jgi:hypothetical protein
VSKAAPLEPRVRWYDELASMRRRALEILRHLVPATTISGTGLVDDDAGWLDDGQMRTRMDGSWLAWGCRSRGSARWAICSTAAS